MTIQGADLVAVFSAGFLEQITTPTAPSYSGTATELDTELREAVEDILDELGKTITFWVYGTNTYDPATGKQTTGDANQYNKKAIPPFPAELRYVNGDVIRAGDLFTGVAAKDIEFTPEQGMPVTIDSDIWAIEAVQPLRSGEQVCLYVLQLRK